MSSSLNTHGHQQTSELRQQLRSMLKNEAEARPQLPRKRFECADGPKVPRLRSGVYTAPTRHPTIGSGAQEAPVSSEQDVRLQEQATRTVVNSFNEVFNRHDADALLTDDTVVRRHITRAR